MKKETMKKLVAMATLTMLAISIAGCGGTANKGNAPDGGQTAKVALLAALSGGGAAYGQGIREGVDLAVEQINKKAETDSNDENTQSQNSSKVDIYRE